MRKTKETKHNDVFISYRRDGGDQTAKLIQQALEKRGYRVFFDVESLHACNFNTALLAEIDACTDFIVVLPPNALDRCVNEDDWLRREIEQALQGDKNIIPIMMRGFEFPDNLPASIDPIRHRNGLTATTDLFDAYITKMCGFLRSKPVIKRKKRLGTLLIAAAAVALIALGALTLPALTTGAGTQSTGQKTAKSAVGLYSEMLKLENGDEAKANYRVAYAYYYGTEDVEPDMDKALQYAKSSALLKDSRAMVLTALIYKDQGQYEETFKWYTAAAKAGSSAGYYGLGTLYAKGLSVKQDLDKAKQYYQKAADMGNEQAKTALKAF